MGFVEILLMVASVILIVLSLLQSGKSGGLGSAFGGSDDISLFANVKERGPEKVIANLTIIVGIVFFVLVIVYHVVF